MGGFFSILAGHKKKTPLTRVFDPEIKAERERYLYVER